MFVSFPEETIEWAVSKLFPLLRMRGAPKSVSDREHYAAAVLRFAHPEIVRLRSRDRYAAIPEAEILEAAKMDPERLEQVTLKAGSLGEVNPMTWLVAAGLDQSRFFLEAVDLRVIFVERFPAADGIEYVAGTGKSEKHG